MLYKRAREWIAVLFAIFAIADASLTLRLSQQFVCDNGRARLLLRRFDADHKRGLTLGSLHRELSAPLRVSGPHANLTLGLRIAMFYNDSTMKNRFHQVFADHPVLLNMGLGSDRIWFANDAAIVVPSNFTSQALVNRSEQLAAPAIIVHPPAQMAKVSQRGLPAVPDKAELTSISRLAPAQRIRAQVVKYTPNNFKLKVSCPQDGWLLVTDRWAAGWRAKVNGNPVEVFGGNLIFRAVRVCAGENTIQFYYPQPLYFALVLLSWSTLVAVLVMPPWNTRGATCLVNQSV